MALTAKFYQDSTSDGAPLVLCSSGDSLRKLTINGQQLVDAQPRLRATANRHVGRGNMTHRFSFEVAYASEATPGDAEIAIGTLAAAIAAANASKNFFVLDRGGDAVELSDAAIEGYDIEQLGVLVIARFSIIGGALAANPA